MADLKNIVLVILASCLLAIAIAIGEEDMLLINYHIHITNDLPLLSPANDVPTLYLHCKSKDDDIGLKAMRVWDDYTWTFKVNVLRTTLFSCNARWTKGKQRHFDAFVASRDEERCQKYHNSCMWSVRSDGIYFSNNNSTWTNTYPW
ncbi:hypothetical protein like AT3G24060 [Hibiscus trionum]|uniref:S-protein homolog n=1 Tax=Hibiscus trionum TaxID=183268 RepID=A0A9W7LMW4_HIBTR|nr:hypothetical protein like AT3G24060 [Hibiscus trionum]